MNQSYRNASKVIAIVILSLFTIGIFGTLVIENSYALSKPYQDKINEGKKKKAEEKKKKEEQKKKEEEEKKKEEEKEKDGDAQWRYMNPPIDDNRFYDPYINIQSVELLSNGRGINQQFRRDDWIDLRISYRISDYGGHQNPEISWRVYDDHSRTVDSGSRIFPLIVGNQSSYTISNVANLRDIPDSENFRVEVEISLESARTQAGITGYISEPEGYVQFLDAYLTAEESYFGNYPGNPLYLISEGDPFYLVVEYEIVGEVEGEINFDVRMYSPWRNEFYSDHFWDRARSGWQTTSVSGWFPSYIPDSSSRITLEVTAEYRGKKTTARSFYTVVDKFDHRNDFTPSWNLGWQKSSIIESVIVSTKSDDWVGHTRFRRDEPMFMIVNYKNLSNLPDHVNLKWNILDSVGFSIQSGSKWFDQSQGHSYPVEIIIPKEAQTGTYSYNIKLGIDSNYDTYSGEFEIVDENSILDQLKNQSDEMTVEKRFIEFDFDENLILTLPEKWNGKFNYDGITPPLTFNPENDIAGMVLVYETDDIATTADSFLEKFLEIESESTGHKDDVINENILIGDTRSVVAFYNGEIVTIGQYLDEIRESVIIGTLIIPVMREDFGKIYVIRLVGPTDKSLEIEKLTFEMASMISIRDEIESAQNFE